MVREPVEEVLCVPAVRHGDTNGQRETVANQTDDRPLAKNNFGTSCITNISLSILVVGLAAGLAAGQ